VIGHPNPALSLLVAAVNSALAMFVWMLALGALKLGCGPQCAVMLAVMLLRFDMYAGRKGQHAHAHAA
jgi:hypothetical protein